MLWGPDDCGFGYGFYVEIFVKLILIELILVELILR